MRTNTLVHRSIAACTLAALLAACASAAPTPTPQNAEQAAAAERSAAERAVAERAAAERAATGVESTVVRVDGKAEEMAQALVSAMRGRVSAAAMGNSVVVSGDAAQLRAAREILLELSSHATEDLKRMQVERERHMMMEREMQLRSLPATERVFDVAFGDSLAASLGAIDAALKQDTGLGLNIVFSNPADASIKVRTVELHRVTLGSALRTLQAIIVSSTGEAPVRIDLANITRPDEAPVVTVRPSPSSQNAVQSASYQLAVFRLDALDDAHDPEDRARIERQHKTMLEAIDVGLEIVGRTPEFKVKLHPPTGMVFVNGTRNQIRVVAEVLGQNEPEPIRAAPPTPAAAEAPAAPAASAMPTAAPTAPAGAPARPAGVR